MGAARCEEIEAAIEAGRLEETHTFDGKAMPGSRATSRRPRSSSARPSSATSRASPPSAGSCCGPPEEAPEVDALIGECDRALATLSTGDEAAENTAAVNMRETAAGFSELAELAIKAASGKPTARERLRLGYAEDAEVA